MAKNAKEARCTALTGFSVDTLWALNRFDSSIFGEGEELGEWAPLLFEDDVL
jgi:hypothetical protein